MNLAYFSSVSENTHRFAQKVTPDALRLPLTGELPTFTEPYLLIVPTYKTSRRVVPPQVVSFLNNPENRKHLRGVIGTGNRNFGPDYCAAARAVAAKCDVPHLLDVEILGTQEDVEHIREALTSPIR